MNAATLVKGIVDDLALGMPRHLVEQTWAFRLNNADNSSQEGSHRHRAVAASPVSDDDKITKRVARIHRASGEKVIDLLATLAQQNSYNSIARCIFGSTYNTGRGFAIRKWCLGTQGASAKSIEMVRTFLIELAQGEHQDTLKRPGGNRKH